MGVAVNETEHYQASAGADFQGVGCQRELLHASRRANLLENPITHQQRASRMMSNSPRAETRLDPLGPRKVSNCRAPLMSTVAI